MRPPTAHSTQHTQRWGPSFHPIGGRARGGVIPRHWSPPAFIPGGSMSDVSTVAGGLGILLGLAAVTMTIIEKIRPKTPCAMGDQRWETQQEKNREFDRRLDAGNRAFVHLREEIQTGLDALAKEMRQSMKELGAELRGEMRRIEDKSTAGDKGLQELSKSMVNAIAEMKDMTKALIDERKV